MWSFKCLTRGGGGGGGRLAGIIEACPGVFLYIVPRLPSRGVRLNNGIAHLLSDNKSISKSSKLPDRWLEYTSLSIYLTRSVNVNTEVCRR